MFCNFHTKRKLFCWMCKNDNQFFLYILISLVFLIPGCRTKALISPYFNPETSIKLEIPDNWTVQFYERNWMIVLRTSEGIWNKNSARIEILGGACPTTHTDLENNSEQLSEILAEDVKRIGQLYGQEEVQIVREPSNVENKIYNVMKIVIKIPTMSMENDPNRIQVGQPGTQNYQTIEIYEIQDRIHKNNTIEASIYNSNSSEFNEQAQRIVNSIQRNCES